MRKSLSLLAATLFGSVAMLAQPAMAQDEGLAGPDFTTATYGGTTIWVGGGVQFLSLPDIRFTGRDNLTSGFRRQINSSGDWLDAGGAVDGGFETPLGWWGNNRVIGKVNGFWSNVEVGDRTRCTNTTTTLCGAFDPTGEFFVTPAIPFVGPLPTLVTKTDRDTDYWGGQASIIVGNPHPVAVKPNFYRNDYFIVGFDVRGIDQDNRLRAHDQGGEIFRYDETLDTTYYGGFIGFGGEYSFGFIPGLKSVGGIYDRLGIRTFITVKGGLYNADTDYSGRFDTPGAFRSHLSKSNDEVAFIGNISLEARKQVGLRTSLSIWTDYEYISSVPQMHYANASRATRIEDDDIFASRTTLRLNIGLGPTQLYEEPLR